MSHIYLLVILLVFQIAFCSTCVGESIWNESQPDYIQIRLCESGFIYRSCNALGEWEAEVSEDCVCSSGDYSCSRQVYNGLPLYGTPELPQLTSSLPQDMDMKFPTASTFEFTFSQPSVHRGAGKGYVETDVTRIHFSDIEVSCLKSTCTITLSNSLSTDMLAFIHLDSDFIVNGYNLPLSQPVRILFKTIPNTCDVNMISEGLSNSKMCSCMNDNNSCTCSCGETSINRVF